MEYQKQSPKFSEYTLDSIQERMIYRPPPYLETVKLNLQYYLPLCKITLVEEEQGDSQDPNIDLRKYFLNILTTKLYREKFQIWTQAYLDQQKQTFYIRHFVLLNYKELKICFRESQSSFFIRLCNKINIKLHPSKLIVHPISGRIYFQTKAIMNTSTFNHLKKNLMKQDCYFTQVIISSLKKADRNLDLILFLTGKLDISELVKNKTISKNYQFLIDCNKILTELDQALFYMEFLDIKKSQNKLSYDIIHGLRLNDYQLNRRQQMKKKLEQKKLNEVKQKILQNSFQFFDPQIQKILKLFKPSCSNLYSNTNFKMNPLDQSQQFLFSNSIYITQSYDRQKQSTLICKKILTYIEIADNVDNVDNIEDESDDEQSLNPIKRSRSYTWKKISEGGFGLLQLATVRYKNLSNSYCQADSGFQVILKQPMVKKTDKAVCKIARQRQILERLKFYWHPNVMSFYVSFQREYEQCLFSDFFVNLSLDLYLKKNQMSLSIDKKINLIIQAIESLQFLHQKGIVHLDIKPGNFIVTKNIRLLLSDFGQAFVIQKDNPQKHKHAFTIPYCAPQIFLEEAILAEKTDVYAIAACIFRIIFPEEKAFETFFTRRFLVRLRKQQIFHTTITEKFEGIFLEKIYKIIMFVTLKAINKEISLRLGLDWICQIFKRIKRFFYSFLYND